MAVLGKCHAWPNPDQTDRLRVLLAAVERQDFDALVMPAEEGGASAVDCLLVEQELPRLGRELFLDRPSPDPTPIPSVDTMLDGLAQDFQGATDG